MPMGKSGALVEAHCVRKEHVHLQLQAGRFDPRRPEAAIQRATRA